jgi:hypothetical protein
MSKGSKMITRELIDRLVTYIREDNYFDTSCRACGLSKYTAYTWLEAGRKELERIESGCTPDPELACYVDFYNAITQAEAEAEVEDIAYIRRGGPDWQAKAWIRERKNFEHWGRKEGRQITGNNGEPVKIVVVEGDNGK